jgi:hypothetical protein
MAALQAEVQSMGHVGQRRPELDTGVGQDSGDVLQATVQQLTVELQELEVGACSYDVMLNGPAAEMYRDVVKGKVLCSGVSSSPSLGAVVCIKPDQQQRRRGVKVQFKDMAATWRNLVFSTLSINTQGGKGGPGEPAEDQGPKAGAVTTGGHEEAAAQESNTEEPSATGIGTAHSLRADR